MSRQQLSAVQGSTRFARKVLIAFGERNISHAKAQRRKAIPLETRQRFAPLRLCVRDLLRRGTFPAKPYRPTKPITALCVSVLVLLVTPDDEWRTSSRSVPPVRKDPAARRGKTTPRPGPRRGNERYFLTLRRLSAAPVAVVESQKAGPFPLRRPLPIPVNSRCGFRGRGGSPSGARLLCGWNCGDSKSHSLPAGWPGRLRPPARCAGIRGRHGPLAQILRLSIE